MLMLKNNTKCKRYIVFGIFTKLRTRHKFIINHGILNTIMNCPLYYSVTV